MTVNILISLFLLPIALQLVVPLLTLNKSNSNSIRLISKLAPFLALPISIIGAFMVFQNGIIESQTLGLSELGFSLRLDTLSLLMYGMVSIIALVVIRYSINYLDGDANQNKFIGKLAITIAFVQLLVLSGNLFVLFFAWVATSISLHQLLIYYPERKKARLGARKKFILARLGDLALLSAIILIYKEFNTGNLEIIFTQLGQNQGGIISQNIEIAGVLLVLVAGLKSVQIPFHGWILEVMEAPTPVSALLHAGLINAGPFLIIRFAYLLEVTYFAPITLFLIGTCTALFGAIVFTTQPTIKTALAYSSIGHMGFTLMLSGLGLYSASLLHLLGHSFYKAHSFLSSGSLIEKIQTKQASNYRRTQNIWKIALAFIVSVLLYTSIAFLWGINFNTPYQLLIIGAIIFAGVLALLINALDSNSNDISIVKIMCAGIIVLMSFFGLEEAIRYALGSQLPPIAELSDTMKYLAVVMLVLFFATILLQTLSPMLKNDSAKKNFGIHVRNGFYLDVLFNRFFSSLKHKNYSN